jgi:hypothetical protein
VCAASVVCLLGNWETFDQSDQLNVVGDNRAVNVA